MVCPTKRKGNTEDDSGTACTMMSVEAAFTMSEGL